MIKPWFESVRIARDSDTREEFEYPTVLLWCNVMRLEGAAGDDFKNTAPKCVVFTNEGNIWLLTPYAEVRAAWLAWLDAASNIQSVFTNN